MTTLKQAAQQALEALENHTAIKHPQQRHYRDSAIDGLRIALAEEALQRLTDVSQEIEDTLAEPEQEHAEQMAKLGWQYFECPACGSEGARAFPKPVQEPVFDCPRCGHCCPQSTTEQEPLEYWNAVEGWVKIDEVRQHFDSVGCGTIYKTSGDGRAPLYTAPPQRKPLPPQSPCEMTQAERKMFRLGWLECEAAHGIKGEA